MQTITDLVFVAYFASTRCLGGRYLGKPEVLT